MSVPKLRFPDFLDAGEWEEKKLGEICDCIVPGRDKPKSFTGDIPWITIPDIKGLRIHSSIIQLGLSVDEIKECGAKIVPKNSVVMSCVGTFGLISICEQDLVINQQLHAWLPNPKINNYYLAHSLILQKQQMERMATNTTIAYLNKSSCNAVKITIPKLPEQQKIADCLSSIDDRITAETQKLDTLKAHKKGLMQQLFPAEGETIPKLRFPEFRNSGEWIKQSVSNILVKVSNPVTVDPNETYYQIGIRSHGKGIFHKESINGDALGSKRVFWIDENAFIVNIVFAWELAVANTTVTEKGKIASHRFPMYKAYKNKANVVFIKYFFLTNKGKELLWIASPGGAGRNKTLGQKEFENLDLLIPKLVGEQQKIADCLTSIDEAIAVQDQAINLLKLHKKGLMQQLFPSVEEVKR